MRAISGTIMLAVVLGVAADARAETITAASCSASNVQTALNQAAAGDTVVIPAGTCRWTTGITWNAPANVTVRGAGNLSVVGGGDATVIIDDYASGSPLLRLNPSSSGTFRLAGLTIQGGSGSLKETGVLVVSGSNTQMRIDHIHINMQAASQSGSKPIRFIGALNGVMDHSIVDLAGLAWIHFQGSGEGDEAWAEPTGFGSSDFIFLEDNRFIGEKSGGIYMSTVSDCNAGGRFVIRYNTVVSANVGQTHPTGGSGRGRGCRAHELYGNTVTTVSGFNPSSEQPNFAFSYMTSGTLLVWGNNANNVYKNFISMNSTRKDNATYTQSNTPSGWGYCGTSFNGTRSSWDGNTNASTGYPCLDQPGRGQGDRLSGSFPSAVNTRTGSISWPNQALEPIYEWNNNASVVSGWGGTFISNGSNGRLSANQDYYQYTSSFNGTSGVGSGSRSSRPTTCTKGVAYWSTDQGGNWNAANSSTNDGTLDVCSATNTWTNGYYKPFTYPHPLTQGTQTTPPPSGSAPAAPSGLRIISS